MIKINKKVWILTFLIISLIVTIPSAFSECQSCDDVNNDYSSDGMVGTRNPAAVYCDELGYDYEIVQTEDGERGVCIIPTCLSVIFS